MDNMDLDVLRRVDEWCRQGQAVTLGTITRTWGSAPRPVGSVVAIRADGRVAGSVSGGCIEDDLIERVRRGALASRQPECVRYGVGAAEAMRFGLPCGGTLELVLEPVGEHSRIPELLARLDRGARVQRRLDLATGAVTLEAPQTADELHLTERWLLTTHGPRWRLLIIGAGQLTQYLADMARALDYQVTVCDPREEYADT
jgi:xanthine dehydrogenase accessory factor